MFKAVLHSKQSSVSVFVDIVFKMTILTQYIEVSGFREKEEINDRGAAMEN